MTSILNSLKCIQNTDIDHLNANIDLKISKASLKYFKNFTITNYTPYKKYGFNTKEMRNFVPRTPEKD